MPHDTNKDRSTVYTTGQQPTDHQSETHSSTRGLPSWLTSPSSIKSSRNKVRRLPGCDSLEDSDLLEPVRKKNAAPLRSTVYCMSAVELYKTALLFLQEKDKVGDCHQGNLKDASSLSSSSSFKEKQTSHHRVMTSQSTEPDEPAKTTPTSLPASQSDTEGGSKLLDDIFLIQSSSIKPPPRKTKVPQRIQKSSRSPSIQLECLVPETVSTIPETAGFIAASVGVKESSTGHMGESSKESKREGTRAHAGPDLSFLDEIF